MKTQLVPAAKSLFIFCAFLFAVTPLLKADDASRLKAAQDMVAAQQTDKIFAKMMNQMIDAQVGRAPQLAAMKPIFQAFYSKYMTWDTMRDNLAKLYADSFSEDELKQLTKFYQSPVGQKITVVGPDIMMKAAAASQEKIKEHISELQEAVQQAMQNQNGGAPGGGLNVPHTPNAPSNP